MQMLNGHGHLSKPVEHILILPKVAAQLRLVDVSFIILIGNPLLEVAIFCMHHYNAELVPLGRKDIEDLNDVVMIECLEHTNFLDGFDLLLH